MRALSALGSAAARANCPLARWSAVLAKGIGGASSRPSVIPMHLPRTKPTLASLEAVPQTLLDA